MPNLSAPLKCPTCGAEQTAVVLECRRCRSDLSLVVSLLCRVETLHQLCLEALSVGDFPSAVQFAKQRMEVTPDEVSHRLLAVASVLSGQPAEAVLVTRAAGSQ